MENGKWKGVAAGLAMTGFRLRFCSKQTKVPGPDKRLKRASDWLAERTASGLAAINPIHPPNSLKMYGLVIEGCCLTKTY
jgi:hypothetical protein